MSRRLIVNADDFGRTVRINDGVIEAHRRGIVTSATLMVAYPAAVDAGRRARELPGLGVGLHLALSGGPAVSPPETITSLVDERGLLARRPEAMGDPRAEDLAREIRAQLDRFRELVGAEPTHVDGHHHSIRRPDVLETLLEMLGEPRVPIRRVSPEVGERLSRAGVPTTDRFDEDFYDEGVDLEALVARLAALPDGTTELMCHPGYLDAEISAASSYAAPREREVEILTSREVHRAIEDGGIELIHFGEL